jgi:hypothetical protein
MIEPSQSVPLLIPAAGITGFFRQLASHRPASPICTGSEQLTFQTLPPGPAIPHRLIVTLVLVFPCGPNALTTGVPNVTPPSSEYEIEAVGAVSIGLTPNSEPTPTTKSKSALGTATRLGKLPLGAEMAVKVNGDCSSMAASVTSKTFPRSLIPNEPFIECPNAPRCPPTGEKVAMPLMPLAGSQVINPGERFRSERPKGMPRRHENNGLKRGFIRNRLNIPLYIVG